MKNYLLPEGGKFYKVNMHSHTVLSDGKQTPEELKQMYMDAGYSAIAFTEHRRFHNLNHLTDENFVAINSFELDYNDSEKVPFCFYEGAPQCFSHVECIHMNVYAKDPNRTTGVDVDDLKTGFTVENINKMIQRCKDEDFLVVYNHPRWSLNTYPLYSQLRGLDGIEIDNGASSRSSDMDYAPYVYDQMACCGIRMTNVAGDDNHDKHHFFHAWTMVKAPALTYADLIESIEKGNSYTSSGPEIKELFIEGDEVTIRCSEAAGVYYHTAGRAKACKLDESGQHQPITEATFKIDPMHLYFRITVKDYSGNRADTRIYYLDELQ